MPQVFKKYLADFKGDEARHVLETKHKTIETKSSAPWIFRTGTKSQTRSRTSSKGVKEGSCCSQKKS